MPLDHMLLKAMEVEEAILLRFVIVRSVGFALWDVARDGYYKKTPFTVIQRLDVRLDFLGLLDHVSRHRFILEI